MARYFFHLYNDADTTDEDGMELADWDAAIAHAEKEALEMAAASISEHHHLVLNHKIVVTDEAGAEVATVRFGDVVSVHSHRRVE